MSDPVHDQLLEDLIHRADLDELIRMIDNRCATRDWEGIERVRDRCRAAVSTGRQLWPAAILAEYRLTLWGPADLAARMVDEAVGTVTVGAASIGTGVTGPLTEVIAQNHQWTEISRYLRDPIARAYVLHECALRGEDITPIDQEAEIVMIIEIPAVRAIWEPSYPLALYSDHGAEFATPQAITGAEAVTLLPSHPRIEDDHVTAVREAFTALVEPWISHSNGHCEVICVEGGPAEALSALRNAENAIPDTAPGTIPGTGSGRAHTSQIDAATAIGWLQWVAASGGAHARRPGAAAGRDAMWWLLGTLGELNDQWPPTEAEMVELLEDLTWLWWDTSEPSTGWNLRLLCQDAPHGVTWAFAAHDAV
jgi:hypothetical protein